MASMTTRSIRELRSGLPLPMAELIGYLIAIAAVVITTGLNFGQLSERSRSAAAMLQTMNVIDQLGGVISTLKDAETGQRGLLLTGDESYLAPYAAAQTSLPTELERLSRSINASPAQQGRLQALRGVVAGKMRELSETVALRKSSRTADALAIVRTDRGKVLMDQARELITQMHDDETAALTAREREWAGASRNSFALSLAGGLVLLTLICVGALVASHVYRARRLREWLLSARSELGESLRGDQPLKALGESCLQFLARFLDAQLGTLYVRDLTHQFTRVAIYGVRSASAPSTLSVGDGLAGQVIRDRQALHVRDVPAEYFAVASTTGHARARELLIAPASVDGELQAVIELGFFHRLSAAEKEMVTAMSESLAVAIRASKDRSRLEDLLEETQRQTEELQTQQEELRVANEELTEQGQSLKESHAQLSSQQAELEQINDHMHQQTKLLEQKTEELTESEGVLREHADNLERASRFKSEFLANMSHELRTPLNSILILAKLLGDNRDANLSAQQVRFAQTITSAGNDLLALINDVLDLARIEAGKVETEVQTIDVARLVDSLSTLFQPQFAQKKLELAVSVEPGAPSAIRSDPQRVLQVLKNLLSNALKFTERGSVSLRVMALPSQRVAFEVRDTGIGIPLEQQQLVFEAFRQADGGVMRKFGGTGLGLSISRDLSRLLGGDISVWSKPGEGSVFTFWLPEQPPATAPPAGVTEPAATQWPRAAVAAPAAGGTGSAGSSAPDSRAAGSTGAGVAVSEAPVRARAKPTTQSFTDDDREHTGATQRTILVIEDDTAFAMILRDLVRELGYLCVIAHTAQEGLEAAVRHHPSAILLDMNLPDRSGLSVLNELKRSGQTRHVPVHGLSVADHRRAALELGAVGYALKPAQREELVAVMRKLEEKFSQRMRQLLVVEDDARQRRTISELLSNENVEIVSVGTGQQALAALKATTFDCMVLDLTLPDVDGFRLLEEMAQNEAVAFPPVIVYTGRELSAEEEQTLRRFSKSIIVKDARSPERLLDEVTLFLHQMEIDLPLDRQKILKSLRGREQTLEGRNILVVDDDVRNIFALSNVLEPAGAAVQIARNGREALAALEETRSQNARGIDLVLMDIMMPEMDGFEATRAIRARAGWRKIPIIALTAKAMKDDQQKCLDAGANDYIAKPLDIEKLLSLIRVWIPK